MGLVLPDSISPKKIKQALDHAKRRGVMRKDIAKELGISTTNLFYMTTGKINTVPLGTLQKLEKITGFPLLDEDFFHNLALAWHEQKAA